MDLAPVGSLEGATIDRDTAALAYATALEPVRALDVQASFLPSSAGARREPHGVRPPRHGEPPPPRQARAVVIDLRGLPVAPGLEQALTHALGAPALRLSSASPGVGAVTGLPW